MWPRLSLKAHGYLSLARHNPWLLGCDEKVRNYLRYRLTPRRERIAPRSAGPVFPTLTLDPDDVMNTEPWVSTRRGLLDPSPAVPPACVGCYTLTDPWRRDM